MIGETPSAVEIFARAIYGALSSFTGIVGITPLQLLELVGGVLLLLALYAWVRSRFGGDPFSFDDETKAGS